MVELSTFSTCNRCNEKSTEFGVRIVTYYRFEDLDGLHCLHLFNPNSIKMDLRMQELLSSGLYMSKGRDAVRRYLNSPSLSIRAKAIWIQNYYNAHADEIGLEKI